MKTITHLYIAASLIGVDAILEFLTHHFDVALADCVALFAIRLTILAVKQADWWMDRAMNHPLVLIPKDTSPERLADIKKELADNGMILSELSDKGAA